MADDGADDQQAQQWLSALRDGTDAEQIAARRGLARVFERRGMLDEAVELLEANVRAGVRSGEIFRWLARLYHEQGDEGRSFEALTEATKYQPSPVAPSVSPLRDRPTESSLPWPRRTLVLSLVILIGLGIILGVALWWVAAWLRS